MPSSQSEAAGDSDGQGPKFYTGGFVEVQEDVEGDVYVAGQNVTITGDVTGDVIAAAQTIRIAGDIDGDIRLAAEDVVITGDVSRSGTVFAAQVELSQEGSLGGDLVGAAETVAIDGAIGRDLVLSVGDLTVDGSVGGDLTYHSDTEAVIASDAVEGSTERFAPSPPTDVDVSTGALIMGWILSLLYALIALSPIALIAGLLFPRTLVRVTDRLMHSPWKALLVGLVAAIVVPLVLLFLLISIIGAPIAFAGLLVWSLLTVGSFVYSAFIIGRLVLRGTQRPAVKALIGALILITALMVPWLNILVWVAMILFGLGAQLLDFYGRAPWRAQGGTDALPQPAEEASRGRDAPPAH